MIEFRYHTPPFQHQIDVLEQTKDLHQFAIFWEMGGGKSKHIIDLATHLYLKNQIDAVLVVAPNGLHANWDMPGEGVRRHLMPELLSPDVSWRLIWHSKRAKHKATQIAYARLMAARFAWLFVGVDALNTKEGFKAVEHFVKTRRVLFVIDESQRIKNPRAERTKRAKKLRDKSLTDWRRILTGTPAEQKPFDVFAQIDWLMPGYWREQGIGSHIAFRHHFAEWRKMKTAGGREFEVQQKDNQGRLIYKNLEELNAMMKPISSRLLKEDIFDLPPKLYTRMYYELGHKQRQLYDQMERDFVIWFEQNSEPDPNNPEERILTCSAELPLVRQLRLHQLALGYVIDDSTGEIIDVADPNPALDLLHEITEDLPHSAIIWCRFRKDIELISEMLDGRGAVTFHGGTKEEDRVRNVQAFQAGDAPIIIATDAMAEGWTLTRARTVIYYSNGRKLGKRRQSEDRAHRPGQEFPVQYIDMLAENTVSEMILNGLINGEEISAQVMGDRIRGKWR